MIYFIFRFLAWSWVAVLGVLFFLDSNSLDEEISKATQLDEALNDRELQIEKEANQTQDTMSKIFRERTEIRNKIEEDQETVSQNQGDLDILDSKILDLDKQLDEKKKEFGELLAKKDNINIPVQEFMEKAKPFEEREQSLKKDIEDLEQKLESRRLEMSEIEKALSELQKLREDSKRDYVDERNDFLAKIEKPAFLHYGDEVLVDLVNLSPSGKGFFTDKGLESGIRDQMVFLAKDSREEKYFWLKSSLVQKKFAYLELINDENHSVNWSQGDSIKIERTGAIPIKVQKQKNLSISDQKG